MLKIPLNGLLLFCIILFSQNPNYVISKINFGDTIHVEDTSIEFVKMISDSRCPTNVTCVRAGEAKVLIAVYKNGKLIEHKEFVFHASGAINSRINSVSISEGINIIALELLPYPETPNKISNADYCLELSIN